MVCLQTWHSIPAWLSSSNQLLELRSEPSSQLIMEPGDATVFRIGFSYKLKLFVLSWADGLGCTICIHFCGVKGTQPTRVVKKIEKHMSQSQHSAMIHHDSISSQRYRSGHLCFGDIPSGRCAESPGMGAMKVSCLSFGKFCLEGDWADLSEHTEHMEKAAAAALSVGTTLVSQCKHVSNDPAAGMIDVSTVWRILFFQQVWN